jgi:transcriptional regulator with XRE-family HTH domain
MTAPPPPLRPAEGGAALLRACRLLLQLSPAELAHELTVSPAALARFERGAVPAPAPVWQTLARLLRQHGDLEGWARTIERTIEKRTAER